MRGSRLLLPMLFVACGGSNKSASSPQGAPLTEKDILQRSKPAIVRIEAGEQTGTGFFIDKTGLVATNLHVVSGKKDIKIKLHDGVTYPVMAVTGIDPARDLAVVRIQPSRPVPVLRLGDSSGVSAGDRIVAIGNPLGVFEYSISDGLVSQVRPVCTQEQVDLHNRSRARFEALLDKTKDRTITEAEREELEQLRCSQELTVLQISAPISQGSSGGPLFNTSGEVVGITTAIITGGQNINLAIPANYLKPIIARPIAIPMDEFAAKTAPLSENPEPADSSSQKIVRNIPDHPITVFDGCNGEQIETIVKDIWDAIEVGAPLYNQGNYAACAKIYEGTVVKYEREAACKGVQKAFSDGLARVKTLDNDKARAWALRDTFDGLLDAAKRWVQANGPTPKPPKK